MLKTLVMLTILGLGAPKLLIFPLCEFENVLKTGNVPLLGSKTCLKTGNVN